MLTMRIILVLAGMLLAAAQKLPVSPETAANLPARGISTNDLLSVSVYGAPEVSRSVRVDANGFIRLPMLKTKVKAVGLMPAEIEARLAEALAKEDLLVDPVVTVNIAEYSKRPISVVGAVRHPLTFDTFDHITLLDALARAEGLNAEAGREILITRPPSVAGQPQTLLRISVRDLIEEAKPQANLLLQGGEEVRVPETGRIFLVGNVRKPGAFRLTDSETVSVLQAIALAEGLAPFSTKEAYIYRPTADSKRTEIAVPLRKVLNRKSADVLLQAGDILYVPDNRKGRLTASAIERALGFASGTASGALILGVNR